jgi:DNA-binding NarL/FixJ family response regulator
MSRSRVEVLIVTSEPVFREGLKAILASRPDVRVVGEASSARAAFPLLAQGPRVVIMDLVLPGMDGIAATREVRQRSADSRVLIVSSSQSARDLNDAIAAGATGYVLKTDPLESLAEALRCVEHGDRHISPALDGLERIGGRHGRLSSRRASAGVGVAAGVLDALSGRERDVFELIVRGMTNAEIGRELCISPKTVDTHRQRIYDKLGCHSACDVVRFAAANGVLRDQRRGRDGAGEAAASAG